ncbi:MAG TPA: hypothetical protein PKO06_24760, partial [Candidatus Ozemobacteraceae bacterium]|nr:hypothetical protein [Candidatus Ozemobacteraceae bacterium]
PLEAHCSVSELLRLLARRRPVQTALARGSHRPAAAGHHPSQVSESATVVDSAGSARRRRTILKSAADRWPDEGLVFE